MLCILTLAELQIPGWCSWNHKGVFNMVLAAVVLPWWRRCGRGGAWRAWPSEWCAHTAGCPSERWPPCTGRYRRAQPGGWGAARRSSLWTCLRGGDGLTATAYNELAVVDQIHQHHHRPSRQAIPNRWVKNAYCTSIRHFKLYALLLREKCIEDEDSFDCSSLHTAFPECRPVCYQRTLYNGQQAPPPPPHRSHALVSSYRQAQPQEARSASALSPPGSWASRQAPWPCSWPWGRWHEWQSGQWPRWATAGRRGDRRPPGWRWAADPGGNRSPSPDDAPSYSLSSWEVERAMRWYKWCKRRCVTSVDNHAVRTKLSEFPWRWGWRREAQVQYLLPSSRLETAAYHRRDWWTILSSQGTWLKSPTARWVSEIRIKWLCWSRKDTDLHSDWQCTDLCVSVSNGVVQQHWDQNWNGDAKVPDDSSGLRTLRNQT